MALPPFNIHKYRQEHEETKVQKLVEQAAAHLTAMREGAHRHHERIAQYDNGEPGEIVDFITKSLSTPSNHREWNKIIENGKAMGFNGLNRSDAYREFETQTRAHIGGLGPDFDSFKQNIEDALRAENMTHFLGERITSTDPNPRDTLHGLLAKHISPKNTQALQDADYAHHYRAHLLREADGHVPQTPRM